MSAAITCGLGAVEIRVGDCRETLAAMPEASVDCIVTSPPYFGLRDYLCAGQIGLEPSPGEFVAAMVDVFRLARRVLKPGGTCWVNLGDSYNGGGVGGGGRGTLDGAGNRDTQGFGRATLRVAALKPKDLLMMPSRVAIALCDDGWWLRSDIIWHKPNPMPESVTDRPTKAHEHVFLLTKAQRYFYDTEAIAERASCSKRKNAQTRNARTVWTIPTEPCDLAHYALMPTELARRCILAGCPKGGAVLDPFGGGGTTGLVAARHGRRAILCELNPGYAADARDRINREWRANPGSATNDFGPLFAKAAE